MKVVSKVGAQVNGKMELPLTWYNSFGHLSKSLNVVWQVLHSAMNITSNFLKDSPIFVQYLHKNYKVDLPSKII